MSFQEESKEKFEELVKDEGFKIFMMSAEWCGACQMMTPIMKEIGNEGEFNIHKFNVEEMEEVSREHEIAGIPTFLFVKGGKVFDKKVGGAPKEMMIEVLKEKSGK